MATTVDTSTSDDVWWPDIGLADNNAFESVGQRTLKGIQGSWPLYLVT